MDRRASRATELDPAATPVTTPVPDAGRANILLVDDHAENLMALEAVLEPLGENLFRAESGYDALRLLLKHEFAVILMDARMPGMDGFETATLIRQRERTRNVPIIFVTAHGRDNKQVVQSYSVGAVDYIPKPFEPEILKSKVRVFVDLYKKNEQLRLQAELIHESELLEAERRQRELAEAMEREHIRSLNVELEARVAARTAELLAANEQLEGFCYSVSHDLRAPLRAISSTSMMLLEDAGEKLTEDEREQLRRQAGAANRLGELIDDLLQLARLSRREMTRSKVDLTRVAQTVISELRTFECPLHTKVEIDPDLVCEGDETLLKVLMQNLLENAFKYSPKGGTVCVGRTKDHPQVFFVSDEGIGIDMAYAHKIFLPFERLVLESEYPGTGVGLATAHRIVSRHGGAIWVESEVGRGSTFFFTLDPAVAAKAPRQLAVAL